VLDARGSIAHELALGFSEWTSERVAQTAKSTCLKDLPAGQYLLD
jgi:hypothetical protein